MEKQTKENENKRGAIMKKQTKLAVTVSAAALLAMGASMSSYAAAGWVEENGTWYYYDKDGNKVEDEWKKSGDSWYWLDSEQDGAMAVEKLIEDDDNIYYVDADGVMVRNTWVKLAKKSRMMWKIRQNTIIIICRQTVRPIRLQAAVPPPLKRLTARNMRLTEHGKMLYGWVDGRASA